MYYAKADQNGLGLHPDAQQEQFDYPYDATCGKQMLLILFDNKIENFNLYARANIFQNIK